MCILPRVQIVSLAGPNVNGSLKQPDIASGY